MAWLISVVGENEKMGSSMDIMNKTPSVVAVALIMALLLGPLSSSAQEVEAYHIGQGDVLEVHVWGEEALTRTVRVRNDGKVSLPLVDEVQAAGRTPLELKSAIRKSLAEYIENPVVTVIVQEQHVDKFYVIGEVQEIGVFELDRDLTVVQALALTGGFTEWADRGDILILRRDGEEEKRIDVDYKKIISGKAPEQNILLQNQDTIVVK